MEPRLYYDGNCALCHGAVRLAVRRDRGQPPFRFAPIGGERFERMMAGRGRPELPDSLLIETADGRLLTRSEAVLFLMGRMSRPWRLAALVARVVPRPLRDVVYDFVARRRRRWFGRSEEVCPVLPDRLPSVCSTHSGNIKDT